MYKLRFQFVDVERSLYQTNTESFALYMFVLKKMEMMLTCQ